MMLAVLTVSGSVSLVILESGAGQLSHLVKLEYRLWTPRAGQLDSRCATSASCGLLRDGPALFQAALLRGLLPRARERVMLFVRTSCSMPEFVVFVPEAGTM